MGISGHAIAENLGYGDGEDMSFEELTFIVKRVIQSVDIPVSVDIDGGYAREPENVILNITQLMEMGAAGINIEDSVMVDGKRQLVDAVRFAQIIAAIHSFLDSKSSPFFVNVRLDAYITKHAEPLKETLHRIELYEKAGADGLFIPFLIDENEIRTVVEHTQLPLNVYVRPETPAYATLAEIGVRRISYGTAIHGRSYATAEKLFNTLLKEQDLQILFP